MGRPKGSHNKKTEKTEKVLHRASGKETKEGTPPQVGHPVVYQPKPEINVTPPNETEKVCSCGHKKAMHYGGEKGHCNTGGCSCLEFKA